MAERARIWRREAGDIAQGAPQRALCDVWRREVEIGNSKVPRARWEANGGKR